MCFSGRLRKIAGAVAVVLSCLAVVRVAPAEIVGADLIARTATDGAPNYLFLYDTGTADPGFTLPGTVISWSFFNDNGTAQAGRMVEPVILKKEGTNWIVTGVGATVTTPASMSGVQTFDFNLVSGSAEVGAGYTFAHHDVGTTGAIEFTGATGTGAQRYIYRGASKESPGNTIANASLSGRDRIYSIQLQTVSPITGGMGPGGFTSLGSSSDLSLWLKGDAGVSKDAGNLVSAWADQSGHGITMLQSDTGKQPLQNATLNGVPVVSFAGGAAAPQDEMISDANVTAQTVFIANVTTGFNSCCNPVIGNQNSYLSIRYQNVPYGWRNPGDGNDFTNPAGSAMAINGASGNLVGLNDPHVLSAVRDGTPFIFTKLKLGQHTGFPERAWTGDMGEVVMFNRKLNAVEQRIVENYLGARFGITLDANDLYAGDTAANGDYDLDVFGIGRLGTDQVRSAGAQGFGIMSMALADGDWVLAGHNTETNGWVTSGGVTRWERSWYVDATGQADVTLAFDASDGGVSEPENIAQIGLFYRAPETSGFGLLAVSPRIFGDLVLFDLPAGTLQDGYYTLGTVPEPGTLLLLGLGGFALLLPRTLGRRKR